MTNKKLKVGIYARVSTRDKGQDPETQLIPLRELCQREGYEIVDEYADNGVSGSKESRPEFDRLLKDMRDKKINTVLVYKLDRIGRSLSHLVKLFEEFKSKGIDFISLTQNVNTSTAEGEMFLGILMVLAQYERQLTIDRIGSGLDRAKANGKKLGRPNGSKDKEYRRKSGYLRRWEKDKKRKR